MLHCSGSTSALLTSTGTVIHVWAVSNAAVNTAASKTEAAWIDVWMAINFAFKIVNVDEAQYSCSLKKNSLARELWQLRAVN